MAQHEVKFEVPARPLGNADVRFSVTRNGEKFGELHISKGAVVWRSRDKNYGTRITWKKLAELFDKHKGGKVKP